MYTGLGAAGSEHGEGAGLRPGGGLLRTGMLLLYTIINDCCVYITLCMCY